jgi:hypothetical protein
VSQLSLFTTGEARFKPIIPAKVRDLIPLDPDSLRAKIHGKLIRGQREFFITHRGPGGRLHGLSVEDVSCGHCSGISYFAEFTSALEQEFDIFNKHPRVNISSQFKALKVGVVP